MKSMPDYKSEVINLTKLTRQQLAGKAYFMTST